MPPFGTLMPDYPRSGGNGTKRIRKSVHADPFIAQSLADVQVQLVQTICLVLDAGGAIHFGMTSDGGALLVRAWLGGSKYEDYVTAGPELVETLEALQGEAEGAKHRQPSVGLKVRKNGS